jgi:hypothetical protein
MPMTPPVEMYSEPGPAYGDVSARTCESCGRQPALRVTVRRHVGLFFLQRFVTVKAVACRTCGRKLVRDFTLRTLAQGWWGMISFFFNWFVLGANLVAWLRLGRINEPSISGTDGLASAPGAAFATWGGAGDDDTAKPKKTSWLVKGGALAAVPIVGFVVLGIGSMGWDATHHDHSEPHGQPMTAFGVKRAMVGKMFHTDAGGRVWVESADCTGDGTAALQVHFHCRLLFNNRQTDDVVVHVLRDGLFFKSTAAGGA